ncbi:MAG: D-glycero-beta-D-manno-heptose 1-phosphate adenylyltransferase [Bacteroidia bacterium]|nr:D-glycero-beta-D-manno-heptose 1-phosphate adenylyltransferase [Bacteroidia bacterium]
MLEIIKSKIISKDNLPRILSYWKFKEQKIVFTNGCFDIIHRGHVEYLAKAASLGDILIVGLNSDNSIRLIKGNGRPIQDEYSRALVLASFYFITNIIIFDEETPYELIKIIKPHILVKGSDYSINDIVGADLVHNNGGEIITIDFVKGYSTSDIISKFSEVNIINPLH